MKSILLLLFCLFVIVWSENIGEQCNIESQYIKGTCVLLKDCPEALAGINKGIYPQICNFQGTVPVVCCRSNKKPIGQISKEKCQKYGESVYKLTWSHGIDRALIKQDTCAISKLTLITGGEPAKPKEFPHMALLGYGDEKDWRCGGTLISEQFVMTAGHCTSFERRPVQWIRLGELDYNSVTDLAQPEDFTIIEIIQHPEYERPSTYNDIALLKMDRSVQFNDFIRPACLHTTYDIEKSRLIASGWGATSEGGSQSSQLLRVVLNKSTDSDCISIYEENRKLKSGISSELQFCAYGDKLNRYQSGDTCQGDSGGPLQIYSDIHCMYDIVGVTSFGKICGTPEIPAVYTRVSKYIEWIENTIWS